MSLKSDHKNLARRLLKEHIAPYKKYFFLSMICMVFAAVSTAALPYLLQPVFDEVFANGTIKALVIFCAAIFTAFAIKGFSSFGESVTMNYVGQKIISDVQNRLFRHLMKLDLGYFHHASSGQLISHFTNDISLMRNAVAHTIIGLGKDTLTVIFLIALMFYRDVFLAAATFIVFPLVMIPVIKLGRRLRKVSHSMQDYLGELTGFLSQVFHGIRVVKAYHAESIEEKRIEEKVKRIFQSLHKAAVARSMSHPIVETVGGVAIMSVIAYGGLQVMYGGRSTGEFISFIAALLLSYEPLKRLSNINANVQEGLAAAARIYAIFDTPASIQEPEQPFKLEKNVKGEICFKNVSFSYDDHAKVLQDISFTIKPGQNVAFVGPSGAGKSTLINLLPRFYEVAKGDITIDGINVKDFSFKDLRSQIALVSQEVILFDDSVFANVAYGSDSIDEERVIQACKKAAAHGFIEKLKDGYHTRIGENGVTLSGGQRQRLAIARAMYKDAPILLLDEATSALDTQSEKQIQKALEILMQGRTTLIVAHRLSTIMNADLIYVLDHGKVVEKGNHSELLAKEGLYANLWTMQS